MLNQSDGWMSELMNGSSGGSVWFWTAICLLTAALIIFMVIRMRQK